METFPYLYQMIGGEDVRRRIKHLVIPQAEIKQIANGNIEIYHTNSKIRNQEVEIILLLRTKTKVKVTIF